MDIKESTNTPVPADALIAHQVWAIFLVRESRIKNNSSAKDPPHVSSVSGIFQEMGEKSGWVSQCKQATNLQFSSSCMFCLVHVVFLAFCPSLSLSLPLYLLPPVTHAHSCSDSLWRGRILYALSNRRTCVIVLSRIKIVCLFFIIIIY